MSKTLMLMVTAFTACLLPVIITCIIELIFLDKLLPMNQFHKFDKELTKAINIIGLMSNIILMANSSMNGMIYSWRSWRFRAEAKVFFYKYVLRQKDYTKTGRQSSSATTGSTQISTAEMSTVPRESWNYEDINYKPTIAVIFNFLLVMFYDVS